MLLTVIKNTYNCTPLYQANRHQICDALRELVPFVQFKKRENTHGRVLILVKLQAEACSFTKINASLQHY